MYDLRELAGRYIPSPIRDILGLNPNDGPVSAQPRPEVVARLPSEAIQITPAAVGYKVSSTGDLYFRTEDGFRVIRNHVVSATRKEKIPSNIGDLVLAASGA